MVQFVRPQSVSIVKVNFLYTGNKYTLETKPQELGIDVREELLKFHSNYYSSNVMSLVVLGRGKNLFLPLSHPQDGGVNSNMIMWVVTMTTIIPPFLYMFH